VQVEDDLPLFGLSDSEETHAVYPFAFVLAMAFRWKAPRCAWPPPSPMPAPSDALQLRLSPAFAWPCRAAPKEAHRIVFAQDEPAARPPRQQGAGQVVPEKQATPVVAANWRSICVRADAVIWDRWPAAALSYGARRRGVAGHRLSRYAATGVWQVPGARYLCIEPWAGHADPEGFAGDCRQARHHPAAAGEARSFRMDVALRPPARGHHDRAFATAAPLPSSRTLTRARPR
jgi:hypothetical protein